MTIEQDIEVATIAYLHASLGPGSTVEEKGTGLKRKNIGERSKLSGCLGRGKGHHPFPFPDYLSAHFTRRFFFLAHADFVSPVSSNVEPGGKGPLIKLFEKYLPCSFIILIYLTLLEHDQKISLFQLFVLIK